VSGNGEVSASKRERSKETVQRARKAKQTVWAIFSDVSRNPPKPKTAAIRAIIPEMQARLIMSKTCTLDRSASIRSFAHFPLASDPTWNWFLNTNTLGIKLAFSDAMESVLSTTFGAVRQGPAVQNEKVAIIRSKEKSWVLLGCLLAWLGVGGFLSWLVADFGEAYGQAHAIGISLLIFSMFILSALVISLVRWPHFLGRNSTQNA